MTIRKLTSNDVEVIKLVKLNLALETINDRLERQEKGEVEFLGLEDGGELVSLVLLKWKGKKTHLEYPDIEDLYTKEEKRGNGYATNLLNKCEELVREKGFTKIGLAVNPVENNQALKFYERLGYKITGEDKYIDGIYDGVEDWCVDMEQTI